VRQQIEEIIGQGQHAPSGHIPFTPRAMKVLELSLPEAQQAGHNYVGTEHILLGLIREGEGVAAQVLVRLDADLNRVRRQVIHMLHGYQGIEPAAAATTPVPVVRAEQRLLSHLQDRITAVESRLSALEQRVGTGADMRELDRRLDQVRGDKAAADDAHDDEQAALLRDQENQLLAEKEGTPAGLARRTPGPAGRRRTVLSAERRTTPPSCPAARARHRTGRGNGMTRRLPRPDAA
jgi:ClpA/ClpB-like protein